MRHDTASNLIEREATEKKLSKVKRGHYRNKWLNHKRVRMVNIGNIIIDVGEYTSEHRWPSREIAEEKAALYIRKSKLLGPAGFISHADYLGPVFFPEEDQP